MVNTAVDSSGSRPPDETGKTPVSKDDAQRHAQLAMYQLAVAEGLLPQGDTPGGGRLVYLGKTSASFPPIFAASGSTPSAGVT